MKLGLLSSALLVLGGATASIARRNSTSNSTCSQGFYPGTDTVIFTVPYTYTQVLSIIGSYQNLTWSGNPPDTVTLNGSDNTVGTARSYELAGAHIVETIKVYSKPPSGPYEEIHAVAPAFIPAFNLTFYSDYDGTTVTPVCNGRASTFNFTINFCSTNVAATVGPLHALHLGDAQTVGKFLGGQNFSSCAALVNGTSVNATSTSTTSAPYATVTGSASSLQLAWISMFLGGVLVAWTSM